MTLYSLPLAMKTFINPMQNDLVKDLIDNSEESEHFVEIAEELTKTVNTMPKSYDTENESDPKVHLHYFFGGWDWFITEIDKDKEQHQAFGLVKSPYCPDGELGYISIPEILGVNAELDFYFTKAPISSFK